MTEITIRFDPKGFSECLQGARGIVDSAAQDISARASGNAVKGTGFHVESTDEPRFQDSAYGVTRPIARVVANDDATSAEEAENKILSKAVHG